MVENTVTTILVSAATAFSTKAIEGPIQTFNDIWNGAFGYKIKYWAKSKECLAELNYKKYISSIDEKVSNIKEENLQEPQLSIVGPALEASKYYIEEDKIREMFANLIASSMDSTYNGIVQHSFVEIIKQLSSYDARLFASLNNDEAIIDIILENDKGHYHKLLTEFFISDSFSDYAQNSISLINLEKQGLIKFFYDLHLTNDLYYSKYENSTYYKEIKNKSWGPVDNLPSKVSMKKYKFEVTPLGKAFKEVCIKDSL